MHPVTRPEDGTPAAFSYSYPGTFRDYRRQALRASGFFASLLLAVVLTVLVFDRLFFGAAHLSWRHLLGLGVLQTAFTGVALLMARSLPRFRIAADDGGLTVWRGREEIRIPYGDISGIERVRVPGWWPLRADLRPRGESARRMIRISRLQAPPVAFISGLEGENELIEKILGSAAGKEER